MPSMHVCLVIPQQVGPEGLHACCRHSTGLAVRRGSGTVCSAARCCVIACDGVQAPLLPATADPLATDPAAVEAHVGECMRSLVWKRQDPALLLESLAGALQVSSTTAPEPATRSVRAAHLAVRALSIVRRPGPAMHAPSRRAAACRRRHPLHLHVASD